MSLSLKKLWNDYGVGGVILLVVVLYGLSSVFSHLWSKGSYGSESMNQARPSAYNNGASGAAPAPAMESSNEMPSTVTGGGGSSMALPSSCNMGSQNPNDLLPKDTNSQWAQLNPVGKGDLNNINLLKAGYHIGIDTVGQTLRNANMQIRSEPPNPQVNVGPWNMSTIESDFMRPPLEIGQGGQ